MERLKTVQNAENKRAINTPSPHNQAPFPEGPANGIEKVTGNVKAEGLRRSVVKGWSLHL